MSESGDDGHKDEGSKEWSIGSDEESYDLRVPYLTRRLPYLTCAVAFRIFLWTLLISFQALPIGWLSLMCLFFSQSPSYITWYLNMSIGLCGGIEIIFSGVLTALGLIQLLQIGSYRFIHKCRVIFKVAVTAFLSHLLVFFTLAVIARFSFFGRMEKEMRRELRAYRNPAKVIHPLDHRWEGAQEKYSCCGFGEESDYVHFPPSCCPQEEVQCDKMNRWVRNCFTEEGQVGIYFINFGMALIAVAIPFAILFYFGFRYFRTYWKMDKTSSLETLDEEEDENDGEEGKEEVTTVTEEKPNIGSISDEN